MGEQRRKSAARSEEDQTTPLSTTVFSTQRRQGAESQRASLTVRHLWGGVQHDAVRSTYGRFTSAGRHVALSFGHNWVVVSVWVPLPWAEDRGLAVPVLFRL